MKQLLTVEIVRAWIASMAKTQGFYGRLYGDLDDENQWEKLVDELNKHNITDSVGMVLFLEENRWLRTL